ncbi:hypothetical protein FH972_021246 [Carpinus fangiana]|uniref:Protein MAK16 homolog n=1 Tax=Carpinus fangiana TaxID=176857 RepID=A0A5N6KNV2_9ROSI|nr:hypothetical protein FH972_021246 [Carpinus fangiana]
MASDEIIWDIINQQFCSFKTKLPSKSQTFCRNEYNATGLCSRQSCPLANSRYATIRPGATADDQSLYLYMKTVERAHLPSKLWEKIKLPATYAEALELVDSKLQYWPKFMVHKCKQRLTRLTQVALRTRRLAKEEARLGERIVPRLAPKVRKREEGRERKALSAAKVERAVERELLERLRSGAYGEAPLNVEEGLWQKVLRAMERGGEAEQDKDLDEGIEEEDEEAEYERELEEGEGAGDVEYVSDIDGSDSDDEDDLGDLEDGGPLGWDASDASEGSDDEDEDASSEEEEQDAEKLKKMLNGLKRKRPSQPPTKPNKKKPSKGPKRNIEYEIESEPPLRQYA